MIGEPAEVVAALLTDRFGTIGRVLSASPEALAATLGEFREAASVICAARELMTFVAREQLVGQAVEPGDKRLLDYLRSELLNPIEERMHALFLDSHGRYLAGDTVAVGSAGKLFLRVRPMMHRALDLGAAGLIVAHNHPSGSCWPSEQDRRSTDFLSTIAQALDLRLVDHLIVASEGIYSMNTGSRL